MEKNQIEKKKKAVHSLYVQVLIGISCGVLLGHFYPDIGVMMKPRGFNFKVQHPLFDY